MERQTLKEKVLNLRKRGRTYSEIRRELKTSLPKSTLSNWCQGVVLPAEHRKRIIEISRNNLIKAQNAARLRNKQIREDFLKQVKAEASTILDKLDQENLKMILAMLYLGEGAKWKGHSGLLLGSSDKDLILLYISLLNICYYIKPDQIKCRISYRADQNIRKLEKYWSDVTKIPLKNFYKTKPDPRTIGKKTQKTDYKGVCVLTCAGTKIQLELEMLAKLLLKKLRAHSSVG